MSDWLLQQPFQVHDSSIKIIINLEWFIGYDLNINLYFVLHPHADEYGTSIDNEPDDATTKQSDAFSARKEESKKDDERGQEPGH